MKSNDGMSPQLSKGPIPELYAAKPVCICPEPIVIDGDTFIVHSAACEVDGHGCVSMYIQQVGHTWQEKRADRHKNTQVGGKKDSE
jgi:hypothetical protein